MPNWGPDVSAVDVVVSLISICSGAKILHIKELIGIQNEQLISAGSDSVREVHCGIEELIGIGKRSWWL